MSDQPSSSSSSATVATATPAGAPKDHLGIPKAEFIEDVAGYMSKHGGDAESVLRLLDMQLSRYNAMNSSLQTKRAYLRNQTPELNKTKEMIQLLKEKRDAQDAEELQTKFLLSEHVYADATLDPVDKVGLWLGANVMLEYPLDEATDIVNENLNHVVKSEKTLSEDLLFLRDQITTTEVSMARVYNYNVEKKQKANAAAAASGPQVVTQAA